MHGAMIRNVGEPTAYAAGELVSRGPVGYAAGRGLGARIHVASFVLADIGIYGELVAELSYGLAFAWRLATAGAICREGRELVVYSARAEGVVGAKTSVFCL